MLIPLKSEQETKNLYCPFTVGYQEVILAQPFYVLQKQTLMQHVLRCDYEACRQYLVNLEQAFLLDQGTQALGALLDHRCDGNRNILHAAVSVCFPISNKETKEEEGKVTFKGYD